jgi:hypothetical protein
MLLLDHATGRALEVWNTINILLAVLVRQEDVRSPDMSKAKIQASLGPGFERDLCGLCNVEHTWYRASSI